MEKMNFREGLNRLLLIACLFLGVIPSVLAVDIKGVVTRSDNSLILSLTWQDLELSFERSIRQQEIYFNFNKEIQLLDQFGIWQNSQPWIVTMAPGYDTLLIKLKYDALFEIEAVENGVNLIIQTEKIRDPDGDHRDNRFKLLKARLLAKQRRSSEALEILEELNLESPEDVSILIALAEITFQLGKTKEAINLISQAETLDPINPIIKEIKRRFLLSTKPFIHAEIARKDTNSSLSENFYRIQVETKPLSWLAFGMKYATRDIIKNTTGMSSIIEDEVSQLEIYYQIENEDVFLMSMSLFINDKAFIGLYRDFIWNGDSYSLMAGIDVNRPNWDFFTSQVEEGRKHRFSLKYYQMVTSLVHFTLYSSLNQYILETASTEPVTVIFQGNVTYQFPSDSAVVKWMGDNSYMNIGYDLDTESVLENKEGSFLLEATYTRKTHGPRFYLGKEYADWDFQGYVGYYFRAFGGSGSFIGASAIYGQESDKTFKISYDRYVDEYANNVSLLTLGFNWIF